MGSAECDSIRIDDMTGVMFVIVDSITSSKSQRSRRHDDGYVNRMGSTRKPDTKARHESQTRRSVQKRPDCKQDLEGLGIGEGCH